MTACWWCVVDDHDRCDGESTNGRACKCSCNKTMGELVLAALDLRERIEGER